ncbi:LysR substrate-binding domain-containing protein [Streptomyces sp. NPDC088810]|uniref:LysR substrate-binding domain-containing protein n=1 Tax=Streptomyces sp. NPDC088810 TaxID=3365904 RepID=UPI00380BEDC5
MFGSLAHELAPATALFREQHPACTLSFHEVHFSDPFGPLRAGQVDLQLCWLPVREPDITVGPVVLSGPLSLMVPRAHPLAGRASVRLENLGDCVFPAVPSAATCGAGESVRSSRSPPTRPPARLRPRGLQAAEHRRAVHQPPQAVARPGHTATSLPSPTRPRSTSLPSRPHLDTALTRKR